MICCARAVDRADQRHCHYAIQNRNEWRAQLAQRRLLRGDNLLLHARLPDGLLGAPALGNIRIRAQHAYHHAILVVQRYLVRFEPFLCAVGMNRGLVDIVFGRVGLDHVPIDGAKALDLLGPPG